MHWLIDPWREEFMLPAFAAAVLVGVVCGTLGCYVVLRRMAFIGDAMAHTVLPGVVVAYLRKFNLFVGALIAALLTAMGIAWLSGKETLHEDTAIGVVFTGMFALGVLIITANASFRDFSGMLFGDILGVTINDLLLIACVTGLVLIFLALFYKELELTSVDPSYSAVIGLRADRLRMLLLFLLSLAVVSGIQVAGVILTPALLVTPAAAASLLTRNLLRMMVLSSLFAVSSGILGLYASRYGNVSAGAAIVLVCVGWFMMAFVIHHTALYMRRRFAYPNQ